MKTGDDMNPFLDKILDDATSKEDFVLFTLHFNNEYKEDLIFYFYETYLEWYSLIYENKISKITVSEKVYRKLYDRGLISLVSSNEEGEPQKKYLTVPPPRGAYYKEVEVDILEKIIQNIKRWFR